jgi:crotonobetainyl-CoA:carnitine CoA-transferase CaiB-like acyl-CoA transferase
MNGLGRFGSQAARELGIDPAEIGVRIVDGDRIPWSSALPVAELALDSVALSSVVLERVAAARRGGEPGEITVDARRVAASFGSERVLRVGGVAPSVWAPLSGFWPSRDGFVRTHGNYPHHATRLRTLLGLPDHAERDAVAEAISGRDARELEAAAARSGAIAAAVRAPADWAEHPQAAALAGAPLVALQRTADAPPRGWRGGAATPLQGVRVLDLTRVIAGPVATRDLAIAGADVIRIDSPRLPEPGWQLQDTGQLKRAGSLDLTLPADRAVFERLLSEADVLVTGYRPGALDRFGLLPRSLAATHPGLVVATLSAWGAVGPWGQRRGFDSIVQAAIGIAVREGEPDAPGALPVQALDHASGHLLAAGIAAAVGRQRAEGGSWHVSVALARTGMQLLGTPGRTRPEDVDAPLPSVTLGEGATALECAPPALGFTGAPVTYAAPVSALGAPAWLPVQGDR